MSLRGVELVRCAEADEAASVVGGLLATAAAAGRTIVLTGGETPGAAYGVAAERQPDWSAASVWWGDERCVAPEDEDSNYRLARETLLDRLDAAPREVQRIRGELGPEAAAEEYDALLHGVRLDLVLLGIGPDGHTASLFPNAPTLDERERRAMAAEPGLEPFVDRVTLTVPVLSSAPEVVFLVTGEAKADALERAFVREPDASVPASLVRSASGRTLLVADASAAGRLPL